jgi:hypothetical protein
VIIITKKYDFRDSLFIVMLILSKYAEQVNFSKKEWVGCYSAGNFFLGWNKLRNNPPIIAK